MSDTATPYEPTNGNDSSSSIDYTEISTKRNPPLCLHCGLPNRSPEDLFCCAGCEAIYSTIRGLGLEEFYRYRDIRPIDGRQAAAPFPSRFLEFDSDESLHSCTISEDLESRTVRLHLTGIHCAGCLWLLERLPKIEPGVRSANLIFGEARLIICYEPKQVKLSQIAQKLNSLGYPPETPSQIQAPRSQSTVEDRLLLRIGVAGFSAANTMMLAVSLFQGLYTGIEPQYGNLFRGTSLILALPAVAYSAYPFYRSSIAGLRIGRVHVDLPISVAIVAVFLLSTLNTLTGREAVYFDSVSTLIFLLLIGRYFQGRAITLAQNASRSAWTILPMTARCRVNNVESEAPTGSVRPGDEVVVLGGERIPVDGTVVAGFSSVDVSLMTGESIPITVEPGTETLAGSLNIDRRIVLRASAGGGNSRLAALLARLDQQRGDRPEIVTLTDTLSSWFLFAVLIISTGAFVYWVRYSAEEAVNCVVAFLIVSCPCALGLAAPTALSVAIAKAARRGILIKSESAIERLANSDSFFFDKTGTLTSGDFEVVEVQTSNSVPLADLAETLIPLSNLASRHPVSRAVNSYLRIMFPGSAANPPWQPSESNIHGGRGVSITVAEHEYRLGSSKWHRDLRADFSPQIEQLLERAEQTGDTTAVFSSDGRVLAAFALRDTVTPDALRTVTYLTRQKKIISILSGDSPASVRAAAKQLGIPESAAAGALLPEDKARMVRAAQEKKAFVGDGVNDALAMQAADVAVSLHGAIESSLEVADVVVPNGDIRLFEEAFHGSQRTISVIRRALSVSAFYNIAAGSLALCGFVNPFVAALVMPLSSATAVSIVLLSRTFENKRSMGG